MAAIPDRAQNRRSHYVNLVLYKVYAELRAESARTYVGFLWWIVDPVLSMAVYYGVFALLLDRGGAGFVPFLFVGLVTFRWLNMAIAHGATAIRENGNLMRQVYLPGIVFPAVAVLTDTVKFAVVFGLLLGFLWLSGYPVAIPYLALPVLLGVELLLIAAVASMLASVMPFVPDLEIILSNSFRILFFVSGIFFSISSVPEPYQLYLRLNPIASLIEAFRAVLLENQWPAWTPVLWIAALSVAGIALGARQIARYDRVYPKLT